jgi:hypothetical protein
VVATGTVIDSALHDIVTGNTDLMYQSNSAGGVISGDGPYHWLDPRQYFTGEATGGVSVVESMRNLVGAGDPGWPIG